MGVRDCRLSVSCWVRLGEGIVGHPVPTCAAVTIVDVDTELASMLTDLPRRRATACAVWLWATRSGGAGRRRERERRHRR